MQRIGAFPRPVVKLKMLTQLDVRTDSIPIRPATFAGSAGPSGGKKGRQMRKTDGGLPFNIVRLQGSLRFPLYIVLGIIL